ncbi:hypothetical protein RUND412_003250 [Rhizina undulata]
MSYRTRLPAPCLMNRLLLPGDKSEIIARNASALPTRILGYPSIVTPGIQRVKRSFNSFHNPSLLRSPINQGYPNCIIIKRPYSHNSKPSFTQSFRETFYFSPTTWALSGILIFVLTSLALIMPIHDFITLTDAETLTAFTPTTPEETEIESYINSHPLTLSLRSNPLFTEARPTLKVNPAYRPSSLTSGTLAGPGKIVVPPYVWSEADGKSLVSIQFLGDSLCGHPGLVHGGLLATLLDEGLARCSFPALPNKVGMTANLTINYRRPSPAGSYVVLRAKTVKVEGRKAWVEGHLETLPKDGEEPVVLVEATALMIEPKQAAVLKSVVPLS